jgi:hypothetical protein
MAWPKRSTLRFLDPSFDASWARKSACARAAISPGAGAISRTGDPSTGEFQDAVILAQFGEVDPDALSE